MAHRSQKAAGKAEGTGLGKPLAATGDTERCQSFSKPRGPRPSSNYPLLMASATSFLVTVEV